MKPEGTCIGQELYRFYFFGKISKHIIHCPIGKIESNNNIFYVTCNWQVDSRSHVKSDLQGVLKKKGHGLEAAHNHVFNNRLFIFLRNFHFRVCLSVHELQSTPFDIGTFENWPFYGFCCCFFSLSYLIISIFTRGHIIGITIFGSFDW